MSVVLGVDGGGSKTHALVAGEHGEVLGFATAGRSNWEDIGLESAGASLAEAVGGALAAAGVAPADLAASAFGLAGLDWDSDRPMLGALVDPLGLGGPRRLDNDSFIALRARVERGELGEIVKTRGYGAHAGWGPAGWFTDPALAGGGALLDMGVHAIDTTRYLLGDPLPVRVCAAVGTRYGAYAVDDDAVLLVTWSNGTTSVVESGWWQPKVAGLEADTELYGTGGYARVWADTEPPPGYEHCTQPMYSAQLAEFVDAVTAGRQPHPSGEDGRVVVRVVEQAYASARGAS